MNAAHTMQFTARSCVAQRAFTSEYDAIRHHLALSNGRAQSPGGVEHHLFLRGATQAAAGDSSGDQRLDQDGHRGICGACTMRRHIAQHARRPRRRPARAHGGDEVGFGFHAEIAFELAGEARPKAIFDQCRRAYCRDSASGVDQCAPCQAQWLEHVGNNGSVEQSEFHCQGSSTRGSRVHRGNCACGRLQIERRELYAIRLGVEAKAVRNR